MLGYQAENKGGDLDKTQLKFVLDTYFKDVPDLTDLSDTEIKEKQLETLSKYGTHTITVSEIYNGNLKGGTPPVTGNLNADEIAGLPNGVVEIAKNDVTNNTIKSNDNIRAVITGEVPIPNGFYYVGGTKDEGVVISDNVADSGKGASHSVAQTLQGNQFVWVPVPLSDDFQRYNGYRWGSLQDSFSSYVEPNENGYSTETADYTSMKNSVIANKGFYVARYEASNNNGNVESKQGKNVWTRIAWGNNSTTIGTEGAVYKAQQMYKNNDAITSTLIYGIQWDAIMDWIDTDYKTGTCNTSSSFIVDSTNKGYYSSGDYDYDYDQYENQLDEPEVTGCSDSYAVKNIYDLGGNVLEWTMEARPEYGHRVLRRRRL